MKLSFQNIGKVAKADIEIDAITVITGENDTGNTTDDSEVSTCTQ